MSCPRPPKSRPRLRKLFDQPWTRGAERSPALRLWCGRRGFLTPHFAISEMADTQTHKLPMSLRRGARRHCFALERLKHALTERAGHSVAIRIDGPYRTRAHNRQVHGARNSQHLYATASDHFLAQVKQWCEQARISRTELVQICDGIFRGLGNETSGTLHLDSRSGPIARFVTWVGQ